MTTMLLLLQESCAPHASLDGRRSALMARITLLAATSSHRCSSGDGLSAPRLLRLSAHAHGAVGWARRTRVHGRPHGRRHAGSQRAAADALLAHVSGQAHRGVGGEATQDDGDEDHAVISDARPVTTHMHACSLCAPWHLLNGTCAESTCDTPSSSTCRSALWRCPPTPCWSAVASAPAT